MIAEDSRFTAYRSFEVDCAIHLGAGAIKMVDLIKLTFTVLGEFRGSP